MAEQKKNTGYNVNAEYVGYDKFCVLAFYRAEFATEADAQTEADWDDLVRASIDTRIFPLNAPFIKIDMVEDAPVVETFPGNKNLILYQNAGADKWSIANVHPKLAQNYMQWHNKTAYRFRVTNLGYVLGLTDQATGLKFQMERVTVQVTRKKAIENESEKIEFTIQSDEPDAVLTRGMRVKPTFDIENLQGLENVILTKVSADATDIVVSVAENVYSSAISGLVKADFVLLDPDGDPVSISTCVESTSIPGRYTLSGTFETGSSLNLVAPLNLSLLVESVGAIAITF